MAQRSDEPPSGRSPADDPDLARFSAPIPSERLRSVAQGRNGRKPSVLAAYWRLQPGRWWHWLLVWLFQNLRHSPTYVFPLLTGYLINRIDPKRPELVLGELPWVLAVTFALCVLNVVSTTAGRMILSRINRTLTAGLRHSLIARLNRLSVSFHDRARAGELHNRFTLDLARLEAFQGFIAEGLLMYGTTIVVMLAITAWMNPLLLIVIAMAVPINLTLAKLLWRPIIRTNEQFRVAESGFVSQLSESLSGLRVSRAHATESFTEQRLGQAAGTVAREGMRLDFINNLFGSSAWAVSSLLQMVVVGLGAWLAVGGEHRLMLLGWETTLPRISLGEFTILLAYYGLVAGALGGILNMLPSAAAAQDAITSLTRLYHEQEEQPEAKPSMPAIRGEVRLEGVRFAYPGAQSASLDGVDLHLPAGTSLALVGASGSGKSTIASLVLGFYDPDAGSVRIDGTDLRTLDRRSLRRQVGVVSQDVVLFRASVLENIAWGDAAPDLARVYEAAERANALEFIKRLAGGFSHVLGDRGAGLSGGQRQRLAIARALYRDPRLLILDEATSALDPESERLVQHALEGLMKDRSTLIIAHRLSTVRHATAIAVLDHGRVVESGAFDDLMARNGAFRQLATGQLA